MSSKEAILKSIREHKKDVSIGLPDFSSFETMKFDNLFEQFKNAVISVGGNAMMLKSIDELDEQIKALHPEAKRVISNVNGCNLSSDNGSSYDTPNELDSVEVAVIEGGFAVAENGSVWIQNSQNRHRALYYLAEHIVVVVKKDEIVPTMFEAYERVSLDEAGYGTFMSGPSKTADIEQSLVIGAHGAKSAFIFFV